MINSKGVRFFLFANSYSANKIAIYLAEKYKGRKQEKSVRKLATVLGFDHKQVSNFVLSDIKPKCPYKRLPKSIVTYLEIENELLKLSEEKLDGYSTALEDYRGQLFYPAIERAIGNFLTDIKNDNKFQSELESQFKRACYVYYKVTDKYSLPTIRTVPFIIRLVRV